MPSAPVAIFTPPSAPTPSAAGAVHAVPSASPAAIGAVHVVPSAGGDGTMRVTGGPLFYGATEVVFGDLPPTTPQNGRISYFLDGAYTAQLLWEGTYWFLSKWVPPGNLATWYSYDDVATPDLVTTWEFSEGSTTGIPAVTSLGSLATPGAIHASPGIPTPSAPPVITP